MKILWGIALVIFGVFAGYAILTTGRNPSVSNLIIAAIAVLIEVGIFWFYMKDGTKTNKGRGQQVPFQG